MSDSDHRSTDDSLLDALDAAAIGLDGSDPTLPTADLDPLREALTDETVVGLGEATHGTREFFQLKHRLVRYLVEELDFRLFGMEANLTETLALDAYVRDGDAPIDAALPDYDLADADDPVAAALAGMYFWTWQTEELRALVEWLREFNDGRPLEDQVRFWGFDAQFTAGPAAGIDAYLETVDPEFHGAVADDLAALDDEGRLADDEDPFERRQTAADRVVDVVGDRLDERHDAYVDATSERALAFARRQVRVLEQASERKRHLFDDDLEGGMETRDRAMAANVAWLLEHERHDRIALWAHNAHVARAPQRHRDHDSIAATSMGEHLDDRFGDAYYPVAFEFSRGSFQAIGTPSDENDIEEHSLEAFTLDSPLEGTVGSRLTDLSEPVALFDFETAAETGRIDEWLSERQALHSFGATFDPADTEKYVRSYPLSEAFDALWYVRETERAQPLE